ncbi:Mov34/MPN/PAD-1 family protein [Rhodopseudomonas palustris]|uniref:Mov34/MPN/PAD-1 family protein n=1 Tax=Rhodopseudomonas palustris TaxID=1076 RepID=UPI0024C61A21|nr:Mov34/MPN/PAD-1 family protein [Rhodopseudomonas palustris]
MIFLADTRLVLTSEEVDRLMKRYISEREDSLEAGGLLLGHFRGPHIEVVKCTAPYEGDLRSRYRFIRKDPRHQCVATTEWNASGGEINYVGEWHTHPEPYPKPSHIDRKCWQQKIRSRHSTPLVFLILGTVSAYGAISGNARMTPLSRVG